MKLETLCLVVAALSLVGCSSEPSPTPGARDSGAGTEADAGKTVADAGTATDASPGGHDDAGKQNDGGGAVLPCPSMTNCPAGAACTGDGQCATGKCFTGGSRSYCTKACTKANEATDCPNPPYQGVCNNNNVCRM